MKNYFAHLIIITLLSVNSVLGQTQQNLAVVYPIFSTGVLNIEVNSYPGATSYEYKIFDDVSNQWSAWNSISLAAFVNLA